MYWGMAINNYSDVRGWYLIHKSYFKIFAISKKEIRLSWPLVEDGTTCMSLILKRIIKVQTNIDEDDGKAAV